MECTLTLTDLPVELLYIVANKLSISNLNQLMRVNIDIFTALADPVYWRDRYIIYIGSLDSSTCQVSDKPPPPPVCYYQKYKNIILELKNKKWDKRMSIAINGPYISLIKEFIKKAPKSIFRNHERRIELITDVMKTNSLEIVTICYKFIKGLEDMALYIAVQVGNFKICQFLINKANINYVHPTDNYTALISAAINGSLDICQLLIEHGAYINTPGTRTTALYLSCQTGHDAIAKYLIDNYANIETGHIGFTPLYVASRNGHTKCVKLLLDKGANVDTNTGDGSTPLYIASQHGHFEIVDLLLKKHANVDIAFNGTEPLYIASQFGFSKIVRLLCLAGSRVNTLAQNNSTAIYVASQNNHIDCVKTLIEFHADVQIGYLERYGPLYIASQKGYLLVVKELVNAGANINAASSSPLYEACLFGHLEIAEFLIDRGAFIEHGHQFKSGYTPLFIAVERGHQDITKMLCDKGALINITDYNNTKLYDVATESCKCILDKYIGNT